MSPAKGQRVYRVLTSYGSIYRVSAYNDDDFALRVWKLWRTLPWEGNAKVYKPGVRHPSRLADWMKIGSRKVAVKEG